MAASAQATPGSQGTSLDLKYGQTWELSDGSNAESKFNGSPWTAKVPTASGTTVVKTGAGQLYGFYVGTATGNITIYDNTAASGTKILDTSAVPTAGIVVYLPCSFSTGLTIVLSGAAVVTALYL